jgi:hypothetical protein
MTDMERIVVAWNGVSGLPGVSVFYGDVGGSANATLKTFFTACQSLFPTGLSWTVPGAGDLIDDATGALTGSWVNAGGGGTVAASGAAAHAAGTGAYVNWLTSGIANGRRVRGRTFMCPLINSAYDGQGTILNTNLTTLQTAATAVCTAGNTLVWHRPGVGAGSSFQPFGAVVPDQVTSLRTRRR